MGSPSKEISRASQGKGKENKTTMAMLRMCDVVETIRSNYKQGRFEELEAIVYECLKSEPCGNKVQLMKKFCQDPEEI